MGLRAAAAHAPPTRRGSRRALAVVLALLGAAPLHAGVPASGTIGIRLTLAPLRSVQARVERTDWTSAEELLVQCPAGEHYRFDSPPGIAEHDTPAPADGHACSGTPRRHRFERSPEAGAEPVRLTFF